MDVKKLMDKKDKTVKNSGHHAIRVIISLLCDFDTKYKGGLILEISRLFLY
jgi:hypothetical protein